MPRKKKKKGLQVGDKRPITNPDKNWVAFDSCKEKLLEELCKGRPLSHICEEDGICSEYAVRQHIIKDDEFAMKFKLCREIGLDRQAANMLDIAAGKHKFSTGSVKRDRLLLNTWKWYLSRIFPQKYSDKRDSGRSQTLVQVSMPAIEIDGKKLQFGFEGEAEECK